jgi:hypothetical protein
MKISCCRHARLLLLFLVGLPTTQYADVLVRSGTGSTAADVQGKVDSFLYDLGGGASLYGLAGSTTVRSLNLDAVPSSFSSPNYLPVDYYSIASPQGVTFSTPGQGIQVSASSSSGMPVRFGNLNPTYPSSFQTYQSERLLAPVGSTVIDIHFSLSGSFSPGNVRGFGAVFSDVDSSSSTSIEFFNQAGESIYFSNVSKCANGLSFLGVTFLGNEQVASARLTLGNSILGSTETGSQDVVTLAGLWYGEPQPVPEVAPFKLMLLGMGAMAFIGWRRKSKA